MMEVRLFPGLPGGSWARLRSMNGEVEQEIDPDDPAGFGALLDRLLLPCDGTTVAPSRALDLAVADHDRIAARLYRRHYGNRIESNLRCRQCGKLYDVAFDLDPMEQPLDNPAPEEIEGPDDTGRFRIKEGLRFRLPALRDQMETRRLAPEEAGKEILRRCVEAELDSESAHAVERAMELVGPLVAGTITVNCPHCDFEEKNVPFSIQQHLMEALAFERSFLFPEVHELARAYGWSRGEILGMATTDRRHHVRMILAERFPG